MTESWQYRGGVKLVVFDWAGTTVDFGCFAPVTPFIEAFHTIGVELTHEVARGPMGLHKLDHIRTLFETPSVVAQWQAAQGRDFNEDDVTRLFEQEFMPRQLACVPQHSKLVPGLLDTVAKLRSRGIKIGTTTGYFAAAAELVYRAAEEQGFHPDANCHASEVPEARPAPWMIYRNMEATRVYPVEAVVKVGDTVPDIGEARNAGCWAVGVTQTGSGVGLTEEQWAALPESEQQQRLNAAGDKLAAAGAHWVIDNVTQVPSLLEEIEQQNAEGQRP